MLLWDKGSKEPHYLFLFNDVLLLCKPKIFSIHYHLIVFVQLRNTDLKMEDVDGSDLEFRLITAKKVCDLVSRLMWQSLTFYALSPEDKRSWMKNIKRSMDGTHPIEKQLSKNSVRSFSMSETTSEEELEEDSLTSPTPTPQSQSRLVKKQYLPRDVHHRCLSCFSCLSC